MKTIVCWSDWNHKGREHCVFRHHEQGSQLEGVVVGTGNGFYGAHYSVETDQRGRTRSVRMDYLGGPALQITADGEGVWYDASTSNRIAELDGCLDVDIGVTPATNTLAVLRLNLDQGAAANIRVAYVPLPEIKSVFLPRPVEQRYTCILARRCYRYEGLVTNFTAELAIDENGLVLDYPGRFRRLALD